MWVIKELCDIKKTCQELSSPIVKKYELWKDIVFRQGPEKITEFPGLHDERLRGEPAGERSSRLGVQYRVIYTVGRNIVTVFVLDITSHKY